MAHVFSILVDLIGLSRQTDRDKDVEIVLLRQQLRMLQWKQSHTHRLSRWEQLTLLVLASKLTGLTTGARIRIGQVVLMFKPETLLEWNRELVRRKWTIKKHAPRGRPSIPSEIAALIVRLAKENPSCGYARIEGELGKRGYDIGRSTIKALLKRPRIPPAPDRGTNTSTWRTLLAHDQEQIIACDFFTVEKAWSKTCTSCFSSSLAADVFIWRVAPQARPAHR